MKQYGAQEKAHVQAKESRLWFQSVDAPVAEERYMDKWHSAKINQVREFSHLGFCRDFYGLNACMPF